MGTDIWINDKGLLTSPSQGPQLTLQINGQLQRYQKGCLNGVWQFGTPSYVFGTRRANALARRSVISLV